MKYDFELIHDTIAKQIFEKASTEARTRRKIEKYIRERHEAYTQRNARLTQDDIDYITPYLVQVNITKEEEYFVAHERKALVAGRRRRRVLVASVIGILIAFLGVAVWQWQDAREKTEIAEEKTRQALKSDRLAQREKENALVAKAEADSSAKAAKISDSLAQIEKENAQTALKNLQSSNEVIVRQKLADAREFMEQDKVDEVVASWKEANLFGLLQNEVNVVRSEIAQAMVKVARSHVEKQAYAEAEKRLRYARSFGLANKELMSIKAELVERIARNIEHSEDSSALAKNFDQSVKANLISNDMAQIALSKSLIRTIRYTDALNHLRNLYRQGNLPNELNKALMELAYFYHEAGETNLARGLVDTVETIIKNQISREHSDLEARLKKINPDWYQEFEQRYYPKAIYVEGGPFTYQMGHWGEKDTTVASFYVCEAEITVWQYYLYSMVTDTMMAKKPGWGYSGDYPVVNVSWHEANRYAKWLSQKTGKTYRLPKEVEWEYAARGGQKSRGYVYAGSGQPEEVAWTYENSDSKAHSVKGKLANELGLYDMSGNVYEWCEDKYSDDSSYRVLRGGGWSDDPIHCRSANRYDYRPDHRLNLIGFRLVRVP